jgi:hypothetical protein
VSLDAPTLLLLFVGEKTMLAMSDAVQLGMIGAFVTVFTAVSAILTPWLLSRIMKITNTRLTQIHTLVNSEQTAGMIREAASLRREHVLMSEMIELRKAAGHEPGTSTIKALDATAIRIKELDDTIKDRQAQTALAEDQLKKDQEAIVGIKGLLGKEKT